MKFEFEFEFKRKEEIESLLKLKRVKLGTTGPFNINLTVLDQCANSGWIQDARTQGGRISRPRGIHMV